jgi:hypothetical protein
MAFLFSSFPSVRPSGWSRTHPSISTKRLFIVHLIKKKKTHVPLGARIRNSNRSLCLASSSLIYSARRGCCVSEYAKGSAAAVYLAVAWFHSIADAREAVNNGKGSSQNCISSNGAAHASLPTTYGERKLPIDRANGKLAMQWAMELDAFACRRKRHERNGEPANRLACLAHATS